MDREDTCHRTCFSLQLDGNVLDNFAELKSIEGLQEGSLLKVVEGMFYRAELFLLNWLIYYFSPLLEVFMHLYFTFTLQSLTQYARLAFTFVI